MHQLAEKIKAVKDLPLTEVDLTDIWGTRVWVRAFNALERSDLEKRFRNRDPNSDLADFRTSLLVLATVDENGERIFTLDDISWLKEKNAEAIERIFEVASKKNGFAKKDVEELEKNSESSPSAASPSD